MPVTAGCWLTVHADASDPSHDPSPPDLFEVAILSVGRVVERPVVRDGHVTTAPIGYVAVTFDHRVVDGARAAEFGPGP